MPRSGTRVPEGAFFCDFVLTACTTLFGFALDTSFSTLYYGAVTACATKWRAAAPKNVHSSLYFATSKSYFALALRFSTFYFGATQLRTA